MKCGYLIIFLIVECIGIDQNGTEPQLTEIEITKEANFGVNFAKTSSGIFLIATNRIYLVNITKTEKRFDQIAKIDDTLEDVTGFEAVEWGDRVILIVAHIDYFSVYLTELVRSDTILGPIQKVAIFGRFVGARCFADGVDLLLVIGTNFTEAHGRLSLYKWDQASFHLQEEKNLQSLSDFEVLNENSDPTVVAVRYAKRRSAKTSVQTFKITENKFKHTHNLYVDSNLVLALAQNGSYFILGCNSRPGVCLIFDVGEEALEQRDKMDLGTTLKKLTYSKNVVIAEVSGGEFFIFKNLELKESVKFKINETDLETATNLIATETPDGTLYAVIAYIRSDKVKLKIFEIHPGPSGKDTDELKASQKAIFAPLLRLSKFLLNRKNEIENLKNLLGWKNNLKTNEIAINRATSVKSGHVKKVIVKNQNFLSLPEIQIKLQRLRERVKNLNFENGDFTIKRKRSVSENLNLKTLKVNNLLYNGTVFEGIERVGTENKIILRADSVAAKAINFDTFEKRRSFSTVIQENITVEEVSVRKINGIEWDRFYEGIFLKNRDTTVEGDLIFRGPVTVGSLETEKFNGKPIGDWFTLETDQVITSKLLASKVTVPSIMADDLNGIQFEIDAASIRNPHRYIETPIMAGSVKIENSLTLLKDDEKSLVRQMSRNLESENLQLYKNKVVINGTLAIRGDLHIDPNAEGLISGEVLSKNFKEVYWLKSVDQKLPHVHFRGTVDVQKIQTDRLNNVDLSNYFLNDSAPRGRVLLILNSSTVRGSVFNRNEIVPSKLIQLNTTTIRKGQKSVCRNGLKEFVGILKVDNLKTDKINEQPTEEFVKKYSKEIRFSGIKEFSSIDVNEEFLTSHLKVTDFNGLNLEGFFKNWTSLKTDLILKTLILNGQSRFTSIFFDFLNNHEISEIIDKLEIIDNDKIMLHKTINVDGDCVFEKGIETLWINDLNWDNYLKLIVFLNESTEIGGIKTFADTLTVQNAARIGQINGLNINKFFEGVLLREKPQNIKSKWNFGSITFKNDLTAPWIDDLKTELLIDTRDNSINIDSDLIVENLKISGSINGFVENNFGIEQIKNDISRFDKDNWKYVKVIKTAKFLGENNFYIDLFENAILHGSDQTIYGRVTFLNEIFFESINNSYLIDDINYIFEDCLIKKSIIEQIVLSEKRFLSDTSLKAAQTENYIDVEIVNNIDVFGFNTSIYRLTGNDIITGRKQFKKLPPLIDYLQVFGSVNSADLTRIVNVSDLETFLPSIRFIDIKIDTPVSITDVNGINFDYFLNTRARLDGVEQEFYGNLIFERVILAENTTVTTINNIDIIDTIEKISKSLQEVFGEKIIIGNLHLIGPSHVGYLNRIDFMDRFEKTIDVKNDYEINEVALKQAVFDSGIKVSVSANGRYTGEYLFWYKIYNATIFRTLGEENNRLDSISIAANRRFFNNRLLYLEHDTTTNGIWGKNLKTPAIEEILRSNCLGSDPKCLCGSSNLLLQISNSGRMFVTTPKNPKLKNAHYDFGIVSTNFCDRNTSAAELNISWDFGFYEKNINFNYFIADHQAFDLRNNLAKFLLIKFVLNTKNTPLILVKVDTVKNMILPIQSFREGVGFDLNFKVYTYLERVFLIMSAETKITLYEFEPENEVFTKIQEIFGPYNVFELIKINKNLYHLILSCRSCDTIAIYAMDTRNSQQFEIFQNIRVTAKINRFTKLIASTGKFLIVIMTPIDGIYQVFKYSQIEGWNLITIGHFPNIEGIFPIKNTPNSVHDQLLLASWNRSAVVTLNSQG